MKYTKEEELKIISVCNNSLSMLKAAVELRMNYKTLIRQAKRLGCFKPNQMGKGINKKSTKLLNIDDILQGKHPSYQSSNLRPRLIASGLKEHMCENCLQTEWLNNPIPLELHHINGKKYDHQFTNLQLLCPNCHALTDNYRAKNIIKIKM